MKQESARLPRVKKTPRQLAQDAVKILMDGLHTQPAPAPHVDALRKQFELRPGRTRNSVADLLPKADIIAKAYQVDLRSYRDLAAAYNCSLPTIQALLAFKQVPARRPGRVFGKENTGGDQQSKITLKQREWLLVQDKLGTKRSAIAQVLGISRERVRQLCERAGHPSRRTIAAEARGERVLRRLQAQTMRKVAARSQPPSATVVAASTLWNLDRPIADIAQHLNRNPNGLGVEISRWRKRWPSMFKRRYQKHALKV